MARIRSIKPEFWSSEQIMECSPITRLLFIGLWNFCDDHGRLPLKPRQIKAQVFPGDDISAENVRGMIEELYGNNLVTLYNIENEEYLQITGWHHQRIDKRQKPKYPGIDEDGSTKVPRTLPPDRIGKEEDRIRSKNSVLDSSLRSESNPSASEEPPPETYRDHVGRLRYVGSEAIVYPDVKLSWRHNPGHPDSDFCGPKWMDEHGRPCTEEGELLIVPGPDAEPLGPPTDWKAVLFGDCLHRFADAANMDPKKLNGAVAKWLKDLGGDGEAEALVRIMDDAAQTPKADRMAWVFACVNKRRKARRESLVG